MIKEASMLYITEKDYSGPKYNVISTHFHNRNASIYLLIIKRLSSWAECFF